MKNNIELKNDPFKGVGLIEPTIVALDSGILIILFKAKYYNK